VGASGTATAKEQEGIGFDGDLCLLCHCGLVSVPSAG
jgi:hypothetical protein